MFSGKEILIIFSCFAFGITQRHLKPCWMWASCEADAEFHKKVFSCYVPAFTEKDVSEAVREIKIYKIQSTNMNDFSKEFCDLDQELRDALFIECGRTMLDIYSMHCANPLQTADCDRFNKIMNCLMNTLDEYHRNGYC